MSDRNWNFLFRLIDPERTGRVRTSGRDYAQYETKSKGTAIHWITQNLAKRGSPNTKQVLDFRSRGIFSDIVWATVGEGYSFTHRINLRRFESGRLKGVRSGEVYKLGEKPGDKPTLIARYPEPFDLTKDGND